MTSDAEPLTCSRAALCVVFGAPSESSAYVFTRTFGFYRRRLGGVCSPFWTFTLCSAFNRQTFPRAPRGPLPSLVASSAVQNPRSLTSCSLSVSVFVTFARGVRSSPSDLYGGGLGSRRLPLPLLRGSLLAIRHLISWHIRCFQNTFRSFFSFLIFGRS